MFRSNGKNYIFSDGFIRMGIDILDVGWIVSSDGENIGRVTYLKLQAELGMQPKSIAYNLMLIILSSPALQRGKGEGGTMKSNAFQIRACAVGSICWSSFIPIL